MANEVRIGVHANDKATKPINDIRSAFRTLQNEGSAGFFAGVGAAATLKAFSLVGQGVSAVTGFLKDSVQAFIDEEAGVRRLGQTLQANIPGWTGNTDAIEKTIRVRESLGFADDELRDSLGRLVGATHDVGRAFNLQTLAMDLARFKGIDLQSASEELIKVNAGQYRSLKALGIEIDANATREEALGRIHEIVAGQAQAFGETTAGAMAAASVAVQDLQEDIGATLAPAIKEFADALRTEVIPALRELGDVAGPVFEVIAGGLKSAFSPVTNGLGAIRDLTNGTGKYSDAALDAARAIKQLEKMQGDLDKRYDEGQISSAEYRAESLKLHDAMERGALLAKLVADRQAEGTDRTEGLANAYGHAANAAGEAADSTHTAAGEINDLGLTAAATQFYLGKNAEASSSAGAASDVSASAALGQASALWLVAQAALAANAALSDDPRGDHTRPKSDVSDSNRGLSFTPPRSIQLFDDSTAPKPKGGKSQGEKDANAAADALRNTLRSAYEVAKQAAEKTHAAAHDGFMETIRDAKDQAYAIAQTTFNLKMQKLEAQKIALYTQRNADASALSAKQQAQQLRSLTESREDAVQALMDAQASGDQGQVTSATRSLRDAQDALDNFNAQVAIDSETSAADAAAAQIDAKEQTAKDDLTTAQKAADDRYDQQVAAEDKRYAAEQEAFDRSYQLLSDSLDNTKNLHTAANDAILAEYEKYLAKYEAKGGEVGKALLKGLKGELKVKLPGVEMSGSADEWTTLAKGPGAGAGTAGAGGGAPTVNVTISGSTTFDPQGTFAQELARALVPAIVRAMADAGHPI